MFNLGQIFVTILIVYQFLSNDSTYMNSHMHFNLDGSSCGFMFIVVRLIDYVKVITGLYRC